MAASVLLPTSAAPVNPPSELHQTPPSTTASRTLQPRSARRFIPASSPNRQQPIVQHLRSFLEAATVKSKSLSPVPSDHPHFALGMHVKDGVAKRLEWKALLAEVARADAVTANTNSSISPKARQQFLFDLSASIANSVYNLLKDERCEDEDARTYVTDVLVWSDAQNARKAIVNDVVSTFRRVYKSDVQQNYRFPVVILATEKAAFLEPYQVRGDHEKTSAQNVYGAQAQFLALWRGAVADDADVLTIVGENSDRVKASLEAVLEADGRQLISTPVLLVLYASLDSVITANLSSIRRICEAQNIKLCVEGPALAFLAQAARPSDPNECLRNADVLLTSPGSWFGFHDCAHITIHTRPASSFSIQQTHEKHQRIGPSMRSMHRQDQRRENSVAPVVRLWTMISQIGVPTIREKVDHATHISEAFMYHLRDCEGLLSTYEGVGCVVRLSYELSRSERINFEVRESEVLSTINKSLYSYVTANAKQIPIFLSIVNNVCVLQFSPMRLLNSGTFWMPQDIDVKKLTDELKSRAGFYHLCQLGAIVFVERLATCADIELVTHDEAVEDALLWYGAFRVVPSEWQHAWVQSSSGKHTVTILTEMLVSVLSDSFANLLVENPSLKELLQTCSAEELDYSTPKLTETSQVQNDESSFKHFMPWLPIKNSRSSDTSSPERFIELPFTFFIHFDDSNVKVPFISVEPKQNFPANMAYRQACTAAEIVVVALQVVLEKWRRKACSAFVSAKLNNGLDDDNATEIELSTEGKTYTEPESLVYVTANAVQSPSKYSSNSAAEGKDSDDDGDFSVSSNRYLSALDTSEEGNTSCAHDRQQPYVSHSSWLGRRPYKANGQEQNASQVEENSKEVLPDDNTLSTNGEQQSKFDTALQMPRSTENRTSLLGILLPEHKDSDNDSLRTNSEYSNESDRSFTDESSEYQDSERSDEEAGSSYASTETSDESEDDGYSGDDETDDDDDDEGTTSSESNDSEDNIDPCNQSSSRNSDSKKESSLHVSRNTTWLPALFSSRWRWPSYFRFEREKDDMQTNVPSVRHVYPHKKDSAQNPPPERVNLRPSSCSTTESESATSNESMGHPSNEYHLTEARGNSNHRSCKSHNNQTHSLRINPWGLWNREPISISTSDTSNESSSISDDRSSLGGEETSQLSSRSVMFGDSDGEYDSQTDRSASTISSRSSYSSNRAMTGRERGSEVRDSEYSETPKPNRNSWFSFFGYSHPLTRDSDDDTENSVRTTKKRIMRRTPVPRNPY